MHISGIISLRFVITFFLPKISKFFRVVNSVDDYTLILIVYKVCALLTSSNETMVKRESSLLRAKPVLSYMYICIIRTDTIKDLMAVIDSKLHFHQHIDYNFFSIS